MARPLKYGLDYFPLDVDIFEDEKTLPVSSEFGAKGECIIIRILCAIYRNGYFIEYSDAFIFKIAKQANVPYDFVKEVISGLVKWEFFDKSMFDSFGVLTSYGIQKRWKEATKRRIKIDNLPYWLLETKKEFSSTENTLNQSETTQKKRNNIKLNNKEKEEKKEDNKDFYFLNEIEDKMLSEEHWMEVFCMNNYISLQELEKKIKEFVKKLENENCVGKNRQDLFIYFSNWYRNETQQQESNKRKSNISNPDDKDLFCGLNKGI